MSLIPSIHATDENVIRAPYAKITPVIDGKFTLEKEWNDASVTNFESNGYNFYLQTKQDKDYVYLMFDGVDFQTDPKDNSTSVKYQAVVCLDADGNRGLEKLGDVCFTSTEYNEFGDHTKTEHRILTTNQMENLKLWRCPKNTMRFGVLEMKITRLKKLNI